MLPTDLSVGGWNAVFVGTLIASAIYAWLLAGRTNDETRRLLVGFSILCVGLAIRIAGWIPWRAMLYAENKGLADWWRDLSPLWTAGGAIVMVIGMTVLMWPALKRAWGGWAVFSVALGEALLYAAGAAGTVALAKLFEP